MKNKYWKQQEAGALITVKSRADRLARLCPNIDILVAFFRNVKYDNNRDQIDFMSECVDVFCAKSAAWNPGWLADPLGRGYFGDRMNELSRGARGHFVFSTESAREAERIVFAFGQGRAYPLDRAFRRMGKRRVDEK